MSETEPTNEPTMPSHPDELLEAFALDALEDDEHLQIELHLDSCARCRGYVAELHQTTSDLGLLLDQAIPPAAVGLRIRQGLTTPAPPGPSPRLNREASRRRLTVPQFIMPLAAVLMLSLFSVSLFMNIQTKGRMDQMEHAGSTVTAELDQAMTQTQQLEEDNKALAAQVDQVGQGMAQAQLMENAKEAMATEVAAAASTDASQMMDTIHQIRAASYLLAHPETHPLVLEPPGGTGDSQGVLLVEDKGNRAFLMISDMAKPAPNRPYQVWLVRNGQRMWVGQVAVDSTGWGSLDLQPPEPVSQFEWVNLTMIEDSGSNAGTETMVLRSKIEPSPGGK